MDPQDLAVAIQEVTAIIDRRCSGEELVQHRFDRAPHGAVYISIIPSETGEFASSNHNRLYLCGARGGLSADGLKQNLGLFESAGAPRCFVWLSPGPDMEPARDWIEGEGFARIRQVSYLTLARDARESGFAAPGLTVRELRADEAAALCSGPKQIAFPRFAPSAGAPEFTHFMAFDGPRPIASAALCVVERIGYLGLAFTGESDRGRGAQQMLISRRVEKARTLGCEIVVSETLDFLKSSLGNLKRAGFEIAFESEVYSRP